MTAEDVYQKYNDEFHLEGNNGGIQKHKSYILKMMNEFARLMCDKQKDICAKEGSVEWERSQSINSLIKVVLNASYPPELL